MAIPLVYNIRSARERWTVLARGGARDRGHRRRVRRHAGARARLQGDARLLGPAAERHRAARRRRHRDDERHQLEDVRIIEDAPQVARGGDGPLVSAEVVVIAALPLRGDGHATRTCRCAASLPRVLDGARQRQLVEGRFLRPGLDEVVVGQGRAATRTAGLDLGATVRIGAGTWTIVGFFDGGQRLRLGDLGRRRRAQRQLPAAARRLPVGDRRGCAPRTTSRPSRRRSRAIRACNVQALREPDYYEKQSRMVTTLITVLGGLVAVGDGLGAVFGALNTMYSAVAERSREIAVLRALGFGGGAIVLVVLRRVAADRARRRPPRLPRRAAGQRDHDRHDQLADLLAPGVRVPDHAGPARARASCSRW